MMVRISQKTAALLVLFIFVSVVPTSAQVESATVVVEGMACPFCAFGVEKRLKKVAGVGTIEVNMAQSSAALTASAGDSIDVAGIPAAIRKAGFTPGTIEATAVGTISLEDSERPLLMVDGTDQELLLVNLSAEIWQQAAGLGAAGKRVRVRGPLHLHPDEPAGLEVVRLEAVD
ncbi:MAG: heavy metal-associated domain-containing protein [Thermoanaerobaculia bacterium]